MSVNISSMKTVRIPDDIHERLKERAKWGKPLFEVIRELLDEADRKKK
jgi:predicted CopG family antitoxin